MEADFSGKVKTYTRHLGRPKSDSKWRRNQCFIKKSGTHLTIYQKDRWPCVLFSRSVTMSPSITGLTCTIKAGFEFKEKTLLFSIGLSGKINVVGSYSSIFHLKRKDDSLEGILSSKVTGITRVSRCDYFSRGELEWPRQGS